jgi:hypothetical protein
VLTPQPRKPHTCNNILSCLIMYSFFARVGHPDIRWSIVSSYFCTVGIYYQFLVSTFFLKVICTNCLILSCHYGAFCFTLNVSQIQPSVRLFFIIIIIIKSVSCNVFKNRRNARNKLILQRELKHYVRHINVSNKSCHGTLVITCLSTWRILHVAFRSVRALR